MKVEYYFTDKNRDYRNYYTEIDENDNHFSEILFHKVCWKIESRPDIHQLQDRWAEEIIQSIINGCYFGEFPDFVLDENEEEDEFWIEWRILTDWPESPYDTFDKSIFNTK